VRSNQTGLGMRSWSASADRLAFAGTRGRFVPIQPASVGAPRVTVVIPCYNYGRYLPACVGSVLGQPGVAVDVIIVDDASPDGSGEVAEELAAADTRVRVIRHERNAGHIATYNEGLAEAEGDYVVLLSADDLLTPGSLERATTLFEAHPPVGFVYGHAVRFSDAPPAARTRPSNWVIWEGRDWLADRFRRGRNPVISPEVVLRRSVLGEIGGFRPELPHTGDLEMWLRAAAVGDVGFVGGADQAWYRVHATNMHSTVFQNGQRDGMTVDLRERLRAFESAADDICGQVSDSDRMLMSARRALAVETLTLAIRPFYWGMADTWPVDDLTSFALEVYPETRRLPHWRLLSLHRRLGPGRRQRNPLSMSHEVALKVRGAAREWRWVRAGL
jgi:glycosyltransferase involved in cell wall biosynthesis